MAFARRILGVLKNTKPFPKGNCHFQDLVVGSFSFSCQNCQLQRRTFWHLAVRGHRRKAVTSVPQQLTAALATMSDTKQSVSMNSSHPQGLQGDDTTENNPTFRLWLENCHRYNLGDCDQILQDIKSGKKSLAEAMEDQETLVREVINEYRKQNENRDVSVQGFQELSSLPDINMPCPQGVQGDDCARFKLWLENCHQFGFANCTEQLDSYTSGRKTLVQLFEEQDQMIREAASVAYQRRMRSTNIRSASDSDSVSPEPANLSAGQKLKNAVKVYGSTVIVFHVTISLASLGFFYTLVSNGIDVVGLIRSLGIGETILQGKLAAGTGTFVVAYAVHKVFAPARIAATLTATPLIVRYLQRVGFLKKPPSKTSA